MYTFQIKLLDFCLFEANIGSCVYDVSFFSFFYVFYTYTQVEGLCENSLFILLNEDKAAYIYLPRPCTKRDIVGTFSFFFPPESGYVWLINIKKGHQKTQCHVSSNDDMSFDYNLSNSILIAYNPRSLSL